VVEETKQQAAVPRRPEEVAELVDRSDGPSVSNADYGRVLDLGPK
jgi:hypothetical protein